MLVDADVPIKVPEAFAAGWQMAELFHEPVPRHQASQRAIPDHLPGLSHLDTHDSALLHLNQLQTVFTELLGDQGPTSQALDSVRQAFDANPIQGDRVRLAVADLHTAALTSLTVADFRLGKAYGLGRALAETVLLPVSANRRRPVRAVPSEIRCGSPRQPLSLDGGSQDGIAKPRFLCRELVAATVGGLGGQHGNES